MTRFSLDIETTCAVEGCQNPHPCEHALDPYRNRITIIGLTWREGEKLQSVTARSATELRTILEGLGEYTLTGVNLKWDLKVLRVHGCPIPLDRWTDDVQLMSVSYSVKVSEGYLEWYAAERKRLNEALPKGSKHRNAKGNSLKVLAPFFLGVDPFWENPTNHDDETYVLKDSEYTLLLTEFLEERLKEEGSYEFYRTKLIPWTKLLVKMEEKGIGIDLEAMEQADREAQAKAAEVKILLDKEWAEAYDVYRNIKIKNLRERFDVTIEQAKQKGHAVHERQLAAAKTEKARERAVLGHIERLKRIDHKYAESFANHVSKIPVCMNLNSPDQLKWLFKDHFGLDITDFDDEESTGKAVLQKLAGSGRKDMALFLEYRKQTKLTKAFFPTYRELNHGGVIHATFHPGIARTGRLTSSDPNLQQVPGDLHRLFYVPGKKIITRDESAIEPRLIAYASNDLTLFEILKSGADFHGYNTKIFFDLQCPVSEVKARYKKEREVGKEVGLALMYGAGRFRLQESAAKRGFMWTSKECQYKVDRFKEAYEGVYAYREVINSCLLDGPIRNIAGRLFSIPDPQDVFMKGFNTYIQGGGSDLVWNSACRAQDEYERLGIDASVRLLVHDEVVVAAAPEVAQQADEILCRCMTDYKLVNDLGTIELKVEGKIADRWEK